MGQTPINDFQLFVGHWKLKIRNGQPVQEDIMVTFYRDIRGGRPQRFAADWPGYPPLQGNVLMNTTEPKKKGTIILQIESGGPPNVNTITRWYYTLNQNRGFRADFQPYPRTNKTPPELNELFLRGIDSQGQVVNQLFAFKSHLASRVLKDITSGTMVNA